MTSGSIHLGIVPFIHCILFKHWLFFFFGKKTFAAEKALDDANKTNGIEEEQSATGEPATASQMNTQKKKKNKKKGKDKQVMAADAFLATYTSLRPL